MTTITPDRIRRVSRGSSQGATPGPARLPSACVPAPATPKLMYPKVLGWLQPGGVGPTPEKLLTSLLTCGRIVNKKTMNNADNPLSSQLSALELTCNLASRQKLQR